MAQETKWHHQGTCRAAKGGFQRTERMFKHSDSFCGRKHAGGRGQGHKVSLLAAELLHATQLLCATIDCGVQYRTSR